MRYTARITRGKDDVATETFDATSDEVADEKAKAWAASLNLPADDHVWMHVTDPSGVLKPFSRDDF